MARRSAIDPEKEKIGKDLMIAVGERIRVAREALNLNSAQLARAAGLEPSYLWDVENKGANMTMQTLSMIASALNLGPRDLFPESNRDSLSQTGVTCLVTTIDQAIAVLAVRRSEELALIERIERFNQLREGLTHLTERDLQGSLDLTP